MNFLNIFRFDGACSENLASEYDEQLTVMSSTGDPQKKPVYRQLWETFLDLKFRLQI